ncbi:MAG: alpha/beta hydrolase [Gemmatimonadales bacterium]
MTAILRLGLAVIVFCLTLLTVFHPPTYNLWKASIGVTELGQYLALIALVTWLPGWRRTRAGKLAAVLGFLAFMLAISPILRALPVATGLPDRLNAAFGASQPKSLPGAIPLSKPLAFTTLFRKPASPEVRMTTIPFVVRDGRPLELDLYKRDRAMPAAPLVITIYGGSWMAGAKEDLPALNSYLASRGYAVAAVSYRLAPAHPFPAATEDVNAAIDYLKTNSATLGIDSTRIVLIGRSAGGQLSLLSAYTKNDPSIRGAVAFYPPTDQKWGWDHPTNQRVYNSFHTLRTFLQGPPDLVLDAYRKSSPLNFVTSLTVPTLLIHGDLDPLVSVRQSARLDSALTAAGRPHLFIELAAATHGCDFIFNGPCGQISTYAIERFLSSVTK